MLGLVARGLSGERAFLLVPDGDALQVRAGSDAEGRSVELPDYALSGGVARQVLESGQPALTSDARSDGRFREMASVRALELRSIACVPVSWRGEVRGVLYVDDALTAGAFRRRDLRLLAAVAGLLAAALSAPSGRLEPAINE